VLLLGASGNSGSGGDIELIPNGTFIFELILFIIVLGIIAKYILPPVQKAIDDREGRVRAALDASDEGRAQADALVVAAEATVVRARAEARAILEEANAAAERARDEAHARAGAEHDRIVSAATAAVDAERGSLRDELIGGLDTLVVAAAERVIGARVEASRHREVLDAAAAAAHAEVR
jgi:F-type H+-transporting ATPase subunit b